MCERFTSQEGSVSDFVGRPANWDTDVPHRNSDVLRGGGQLQQVHPIVIEEFDDDEDTDIATEAERARAVEAEEVN